ncbi:MAG TPA: ATP-binding protein, partial [Polyangiaceae bacterium]|nr:ATP-binding protein [Polyangiaceae bacterium]
RELTEQHMVLLDNAPLLIFRLDPETGEVLYLNRHAEKLFGVPASKALSTPGFLHDAHVDPEGATAFEEAVVVARLGQVMPPYEARLRREGGESIIARGTIYPILADGGRVSGIEGILLDVTGERAARSRLLQADRLATVGMLAAGVAHEINNPAAFMLLGLDVLGRTVLGPNVTMTPEADAQARQLIADLKETGRRIVEIARDMRTFASPPGQGKRTLVDVARTIDSALTITRAQIVEKAEIEVDISPELPLVAMEDGRLGQVLVNLLVNAAQAITDAKATRGPLPGGDRVRIRAVAASNRVEISVEDTGPGMRSDVIERVFTPFFTTRQPEGGTGLGLAISKTIVEAAGGTITASSPSTLGDPPCGSMFAISLPAFIDVIEAPDSSVPAEEPSTPARVLIVEDEVLLGRALADQLSEPHEVTVVSGSEEALARLAEEKFDVVLCDVKMPTMGGEELYRRVAETDKEQARRFIFMTGIGFDPELEKFLSHVGAPLLEKPFPIRRAQRVIAEMVALRGKVGDKPRA